MSKTLVGDTGPLVPRRRPSPSSVGKVADPLAEVPVLLRLPNLSAKRSSAGASEQTSVSRLPDIRDGAPQDSAGPASGVATDRPRESSGPRGSIPPQASRSAGAVSRPEIPNRNFPGSERSRPTSRWSRHSNKLAILLVMIGVVVSGYLLLGRKSAERVVTPKEPDWSLDSLEMPSPPPAAGTVQPQEDAVEPPEVSGPALSGLSLPAAAEPVDSGTPAVRPPAWPEEQSGYAGPGSEQASRQEGLPVSGQTSQAAVTGVRTPEGVNEYRWASRAEAPQDGGLHNGGAERSPGEISGNSDSPYQMPAATSPGSGSAAAPAGSYPGANGGSVNPVAPYWWPTPDSPGSYSVPPTGQQSPAAPGAAPSWGVQPENPGAGGTWPPTGPAYPSTTPQGHESWRPAASSGVAPASAEVIRSAGREMPVSYEEYPVDAIYRHSESSSSSKPILSR